MAIQTIDYMKWTGNGVLCTKNTPEPVRSSPVEIWRQEMQWACKYSSLIYKINVNLIGLSRESDKTK